MAFLFKNFLESKEGYIECKSWWEDRLNSIISEDLILENFLNTSSFFDGNPIISKKLKGTTKTFRIVQNDPKEIEGAKELNLVQFWEDELGEVDELVISIYLTEASGVEALNLIKNYLVNEIK